MSDNRPVEIHHHHYHISGDQSSNPYGNQVPASSLGHSQGQQGQQGMTSQYPQNTTGQAGTGGIVGSHGGQGQTGAYDQSYDNSRHGGVTDDLTSGPTHGGQQGFAPGHRAGEPLYANQTAGHDRPSFGNDQQHGYSGVNPAGGAIAGAGAGAGHSHPHSTHDEKPSVGDKIKGAFGMKDPAKEGDHGMSARHGRLEDGSHAGAGPLGRETGHSSGAYGQHEAGHGDHTARNAALGAGAGAGAAHLAHGANHHQQGTYDQQNSHNPLHSDSSRHPESKYGQDAALGTGSAAGASHLAQADNYQPGYTANTHQGSHNPLHSGNRGEHDSHLGRDAALGAGAGAGGAHLLNKHHDNQAGTTAGHPGTTGRTAGAAHLAQGDNYQPGYTANTHQHQGSHNPLHSNNRGEHDSHLGRDAAIGAGAGAGGAHLLNKHHDDQTGSHGHYATGTTGHGPSHDNSPRSHHSEGAMGAGMLTGGEAAHLAHDHEKHSHGAHHNDKHLGQGPQATAYDREYDGVRPTGSHKNHGGVLGSESHSHPAEKDLEQYDREHGKTGHHGATTGAAAGLGAAEAKHHHDNKATHGHDTHSKDHHAKDHHDTSNTTGSKPSAFSKLAGKIEVVVGKVSGDKEMVAEGEARKAGLPIHKSGDHRGNVSPSTTGAATGPTTGAGATSGTSTGTGLGSHQDSYAKTGSSHMGDQAGQPNRQGGLSENYDHDRGLPHQPGAGTTGLERDVERMGVGERGNLNSTSTGIGSGAGGPLHSTSNTQQYGH